MCVLVTGATGRVGEQVVRELVRMGQPVRALVRPGSAYFWLDDTGCSYFFGDLRDRRSLLRATKDVQFVVVCSGVDRETRSNHHQTLVDGHAALLDAARERAVEAVVYVSSIGVDRAYPIPWFDARARCEDLLVRSGLRHAIVRLAPLTRTFAEVVRAGARRGRIVVPGPGDNPVMPISSRDAALYAIAALDLPGSVLEAAGPERLTSLDAVRRAMSVAGTGVPVSTLSPRVVELLARTSRLAGRRWMHHIRHRARWFTDPFVVDAPIEGIAPEPLDAALKSDFALLRMRADPRARYERVPPRRFAASVYTPGVVRRADLPRGPLRYDD